MINFCSNDYLSLSNHPQIKRALTHSVSKYGVGSGSSALISGYFKPHHALEEAFAEFLGRDKALLFNSGYHANLSVMTTFANRNNIIIADKFCHASLIDGIILSRAKHYRYHHNDISHAEHLIKKMTSNNFLLITESIFSMQGTLSPIKKLASLSSRYRGMFIVDDTHGIGILGKEGKGIIEYAHLSQKEIPCLITPFGKAFGSIGAIVSGSHSLIEELLQSARAYRYTTALPPALCDATREAIKIIQCESWRREKLEELSRFFIKEALQRKLNLVSDDCTPIKPLLVGSNKNAYLLQEKLMGAGFFVSCIRPPTVPKNTARLRISLNCLHRKTDIVRLLDEIENFMNNSTKL